MKQTLALAAIPAFLATACAPQVSPPMTEAEGQQYAQAQSDDGIGSELLAAGAGAAVGYLAGKSSSKPKTVIQQKVIVNKVYSAPRPTTRYTVPQQAPRYIAPQAAAPRVSAPAPRNYRPSFSSRRR